MLTEKQRAVLTNEGARRRYGTNREAHNARRRELYAADELLRHKAQLRAARYRKENLMIVRKLYRELNGKKVEVFSTGQVAELIERTPQLLRNWEKAGLIPSSTFSDKHQLYTKAQVRMLVSLAKIIANNGGTWSAPEVKAKIRKIKQRW